MKKAKHGICGAHLLRDLAGVAQVRSQAVWSTALVEINEACHHARALGHRGLAPTSQRSFAARYDQLVTDGLAANPAPVSGRNRNRLEAGSYNLPVAFRDRRSDILRFMRNLDVGFANNQAERDLRPVKLHRKISSCFKSQAGAERFAHVRSYLSTTRKHDIGALGALTDLFNGKPWMPPHANNLNGYDWDAFHPDARRLLDDPFFWSCIDDFATHWERHRCRCARRLRGLGTQRSRWSALDVPD